MFGQAARGRLEELDLLVSARRSKSPLRKINWEQRAPCRRPRRAPRRESSMPRSNSVGPGEREGRSITRAGETVESKFRPFLDRQAKRLKPRSYAEVERHLLIQAKPLHRLPLAAVDRRSLRSCCWRLGNWPDLLQPIACAPTFTRFSLGRSATDRPRRIPSPTPTGMKRPVRATAFCPRRVAGDLDGDRRQRPVLRHRPLVALDGCKARRDRQPRMAEVDLDNAMISLPGERTKNSKPLDIPLSPAALAILEAQPRRDRAFIFGRGQGGFNGGRRAKRNWTGARALRPGACMI